MDYLQQRWFDRLMRHSRVEKRPLVPAKLGPCYTYMGPKTAGGYGKISVRLPGRKNPTGVSTHVLSFRMFVRAVRAGFDVSHQCHNAACWNPKHLREETHVTNCKWREQRRKGV